MKLSYAHMPTAYNVYLMFDILMLIVEYHPFSFGGHGVSRLPTRTNNWKRLWLGRSRKLIDGGRTTNAHASHYTCIFIPCVVLFSMNSLTAYT